MQTRIEKKSKKTTVPLQLFVSQDLLRMVDAAAQSLDLDRSKFVRAALREKLQNHQPQPTPLR